MNETTKTAAFVGSAVAMLLAAVFTSYANQPKPSDDYETIGQPFYADFEETNQARSLLVTSIDPDAIKEQKFEIKQIDGLWQIPSHEGYPAEAAERLAKTSASLVGLTRDSLVGRRTSDYEKFGVVDPRSDDLLDIESVGQSITLRDANEDVLVDFIIGNRADDAEDDQPTMPGAADDEESFYYVRRSDETNVYRIPLNIELSTKFSDWIEPDLLQMEASDLVQLAMNNYQIQERSSGMFGQVKELTKIKGDKFSLSRRTSTDDWEIGDLKPESEKVDQTAVDAIVSVLDEMAIVDVKKKPTLNGRILLDADLNYSVTPEQAQLMSIRTQRELDALTTNQKAEFQSLQMGIMELQRDLESKGFSIGSTGRKIELVSTGGEMKAGTSSGLLYTLHIGKAPTDTVEEIKVSGATDEGSEKKESDGSDETDADDKDTDDQAADPGDDTESKTDAKTNGAEGEGGDDSNRYVLIRVAFDDSLLTEPGDKPVAPTEPAKPEGYTEATEDDAAKKADSKNAQTETGDAGEEDEAPKPSDMKRNAAFVKYDADLAAFEEAKVDFEVAVSTYDAAVEEKEAQVKIGKQKAKILNGRFEKWYYIVNSENLKTLQSGRTEVIEPVITTTPGGDAAAEARAAAKAMVARPDVSFPVVDTEEVKDAADPKIAKPIEKPTVQQPEVDKETKTAPSENGDGKMEETADQVKDASASELATEKPIPDEESPSSTEPSENPSTEDPELSETTEGEEESQE